MLSFVSKSEPKLVEEKFCKFGACAATNLNLLSTHTSTDEYRVDENVLMNIEVSACAAMIY